MTLRVPSAALAMVICACGGGSRPVAEQEGAPATAPGAGTEASSEARRAAREADARTRAEWARAHRAEWFAKARAALPSAPSADALMGVALLGTGEEALPLLRRAVDRLPGDALPHLLLGLTLQGSWDGWLALPDEARDLAGAAEALERAARLDPTTIRYAVFSAINRSLAGDANAAAASLRALARSRGAATPFPDLFDRVALALRSAGADDAVLARFHAALPTPRYAPLHEIPSAALPPPASEAPDPGAVLAIARDLAAVGERLASGSGPAAERLAGAALVSAAGERVAALLPPDGPGEARSEAVAWVERAGAARTEILARVDAGAESWWHWRLAELEWLVDGGQIPAADFARLEASARAEKARFYSDTP
ncbi:hypothetical protein L6R50_18985 [Myxococcota bacterium]|nr:hypothetical protein [Myxococcota bacterium]